MSGEPLKIAGIPIDELRGCCWAVEIPLEQPDDDDDTQTEEGDSSDDR